MNAIFSSHRYTLKARSESHFREELFISPPEATRAGIPQSGKFGILSIEALWPGPPDEEFAVRISVDSAVSPGEVQANGSFLNSIGARPEDGRIWSIKSPPSVVSVVEAIIELVVEPANVTREIDELKRQRRELFVDRCLLAEPGRAARNLSLPTGRGYFNFRSLQPSPESLPSKTLLVFDEKTALKLFVPHRKSGVDMVIAVDASGSMDLHDYVDENNRARSRIDGVRGAMEKLLQRRLVSGTRVSRIAAIVFGANTQMLYPVQDQAMVELRSEAQIDEMRASIRNLSALGLDRLRVDRNHTDISGALQYAAELLDYYFEEGNEKMVILLSDGADWTEDTEGVSQGEVVTTARDPAVLADSLGFDSQIRIHTIAISNETALRTYEDRKYWSQGWAIPNKRLLEKVAGSTDGLFFEQPDARSLSKLFDEIGQGVMYSLG